MLYIEDFDNLVLVFDNLKTISISKGHIQKFYFNEVSRSVEYDSKRDVFKKGLVVNNFKLEFKGFGDSIRSFKCNKVIFKKGRVEIGSLKINKPLKLIYNEDIIIIKSDDVK